MQIAVHKPSREASRGTTPADPGLRNWGHVLASRPCGTWRQLPGLSRADMGTSVLCQQHGGGHPIAQRGTGSRTACILLELPVFLGLSLASVGAWTGRL